MNTRALQQRLAALGYSPGAIDGKPGPKTTAAVKAFQRAHGLAADGIVGPRTERALQAAEARDEPPQRRDEPIPSDHWEAFAPRALPGMREALNRAALAYGVTTPLRVCHWLGQMFVESQGFTVLEENLSYSARRLMQVWPRRFPTLEAAQPYAQNPRALANKTYGGRMGNTGPDDGWRYRGRGPKQLTGHDNYAWAEGVTGHTIVANPDLVKTDLQVGADVAGAYFRDKGCAGYADRDDIAGLTEAINGGLIGLAERTTATNRAKRIWGVG